MLLEVLLEVLLLIHAKFSVFNRRKQEKHTICLIFEVET